MKKAGIIGGAGFIGSYITKEFLENGFTVKVSVTDISKQEHGQHGADDRQPATGDGKGHEAVNAFGAGLV